MQRKEEQEKLASRKEALISSSYKMIDIPADLGMDCGLYKWRQNQSHVEMFVALPEHVKSASKVSVTLKPNFISVEIDEKCLLKGTLYKQIKVEESTWYVHEGVLEISMLKRSRRGQYADGETNADTYWKSVIANPSEREVLKIDTTPSKYYWCPNEELGDGPRPRRAKKAITNK